MQKQKTGFLSRNRHVLYILPWLIGFLIFQALPMLYSLICGFTDFHMFRGITQTGTMNYVRIFTDPEALRAIGKTLQFAVISVPLKITAAMLAALLLTKPLRGIGIYRTLYYLPSILGGSVAAAVLWKAMFRDHGLVNGILSAIGLPQPQWLAEPQGAFWVRFRAGVYATMPHMDVYSGIAADSAGADRCRSAGRSRQHPHLFPDSSAADLTGRIL